MAGLTACATGPTVRTADDAKPGEAVVYGRAAITLDGKPAIWTDKLEPGEFYLLLLPDGAKGAERYKLKGDGSFNWALPPGRYAIAGYHWLRYSLHRSGRIWAEFTVPKGAGRVYIGTLNIAMKGSSYLTSVADEADVARKQLSAKITKRPGSEAKGLLEIVSPSANARHVRDICDKQWGLPCEQGYKGVIPLKIGNAGGHAPKVADLQPTLQWRPAKAPGVRYDVIVYENITYMTGARQRHMHGWIIDQAQGLERPSHRLKRALKPGRRYFWSVRLRKGDTISNWSLYSFSSFYGIGYGQARGLYYHFETPGKGL